MRSCHSERGLHGTWTASPECAPQPSGVACVGSSHAGSLSPHRFCGCAGYNRARLRLVGPSGCRIPCPGTSSEARSRSVQDVPPQWLRWWLPGACCHGRSHRRSRHPADRHRLRRLGCVSSPVCPDRWDLAPFFSPKAGFGQGAVGRLPLPTQAAEFLTLTHQFGPHTGHHAVLVPTLKPTMHGAVVAEFLLRQLVPLAARSHTKDDAVEASPPFGVLAAGGFRRPVFLQDRLNPLP